MSVHRMHPDPDRGASDTRSDKRDDPDAILWDDCERCAEHAHRPLLGLDNDNLSRLWERVCSVELDMLDGPDHYLSINEADAGRELYKLYLVAANRPKLMASIVLTAHERRTARSVGPF